LTATQLADPALRRHYRDAAPAPSSPMAPMLRLVERLAAREYAALIPAATSHDILVLGGPGQDHVSVEYWPDLRLFRVQYWAHSSARPESHRCEAEEAERLIDSLVVRLGMRTTNGSER
jgi:hypothetical protein